MKKVIVNICRLVLAVAFIFSGFVKAVDPLGTKYKISDYLSVWGIEKFIPDALTITASVALATFEFTVGILLLFSIRRRLMSKLALIFMSLMTLLTIWIAIANPVEDCGCFGDALILSNVETLVKNVILLAAAIVVACAPLMMRRFISKNNQWIVTNYTLLFILVIAAIGLTNLPVLDFRPYKMGADIKKATTLPEGAKLPEYRTTFILEKNGERKEFDVDNYPDSTWTFIDSKTEKIADGDTPEITDFSVEQKGEDITQDILSDTSYTFLLVSPFLEQADDTELDDINTIYEYCVDNGYKFYCLTASNEDAINRWIDITGAEYPFCSTDETTLKTVVRSNPGLVLLKDGVVINKWSHNRLPKEEDLTGKLNTLQIGKLDIESKKATTAKIILWFIIPLLILTIADRLWAWSKWVKKKEERLYFYKHIKNKEKMRKKIVAGNWKMNMNLQDGVALAKELNETLAADKPNCGVIICTPFIHLATIAQFLNQDIIGLGAENCADKEKGAYTGEVSAEMVKSTGAQYVILGHSERRGYYGETPEILKEKVLLALKNNLKVIFCIGESLEEREANKQNEVVKAELEGSVFNLSADEFKNIIIAYEPIWAIGTGKTATSDQAEEIHAYIRSIIADKYGKEVAEDTTILYGGSCKASNAPELFAKPDIDGGLIGGASLKAADFKGIIDAWKK